MDSGSPDVTLAIEDSSRENTNKQKSSNMSWFKCYICNFISKDQPKINQHMKIDHNIKVEFDETNEKFTSSICDYKKENIDDFKNHMIHVHKKDQWNWGLEVKSTFTCGECDIEFPSRSTLRNHLEGGHMEVNNAVITDNIKIIEPDEEFISQNTQDLEIILKTVPNCLIYNKEDEFQKDFDEVINKRVFGESSPGPLKCQNQFLISSLTGKVLRH